MYTCKILTRDFLDRVNKYIMDYVRDLEGEEKDAMIKQRMKVLRRLWTDPQSYAQYPQIREYYEKLHLYYPEYSEMVFTIPKPDHIYWIQKVRRVDEIEEIIEYKETEEV